MNCVADIGLFIMLFQLYFKSKNRVAIKLRTMISTSTCKIAIAFNLLLI